MAISQEFADFVQELLSPLGNVKRRRMFGGTGFFRYGKMFALIYGGNNLYFKSRTAHPLLGGQLIYRRTDKVSGMPKEVGLPYFQADGCVFDDSEALLALAHAAFDASGIK